MPRWIDRALRRPRGHLLDERRTGRRGVGLLGRRSARHAPGVPRPLPRDHRASRRTPRGTPVVAPWESLPAPNYRSDYVRSRVLQRYGGVWMDVDTVALSPLSQLIDELDASGMVCFGREVGRFFGGLCAAAPGTAFVDAWV